MCNNFRDAFERVDIIRSISNSLSSDEEANPIVKLFKCNDASS